MPPKAISVARKEYNKYAEKRGIKKPHKMSIDDLRKAVYRQDIKRKSYRIRRKFKRLGLSNLVKKQNVLESDFHKAERLHNKSIDDLRKIAILRRIKSYDNLSREDLIYSILRSERHPKERNYMQ